MRHANVAYIAIVRINLLGQFENLQKSLCSSGIKNKQPLCFSFNGNQSPSHYSLSFDPRFPRNFFIIRWCKTVQAVLEDVWNFKRIGKRPKLNAQSVRASSEGHSPDSESWLDVSLTKSLPLKHEGAKYQVILGFFTFFYGGLTRAKPRSWRWQSQRPWLVYFYGWNSRINFNVNVKQNLWKLTFTD